MPVERICTECGKIFKIIPSKIKQRALKFCCRECYLINKKRNKKSVKKICPICGKEFEVFPRTLKRGGGVYCSRECQYKARRKYYYVDEKTYLIYFNKYRNLMGFYSKRYTTNTNIYEDLFQHQSIALFRIVSNGLKTGDLKKYPESYFKKALTNEARKFSAIDGKYRENIIYLEDFSKIESAM